MSGTLYRAIYSMLIRSKNATNCSALQRNVLLSIGQAQKELFQRRCLAIETILPSVEKGNILIIPEASEATNDQSNTTEKNTHLPAKLSIQTLPTRVFVFSLCYQQSPIQLHSCLFQATLTLREEKPSKVFWPHDDSSGFAKEAV